MMRKIFLIAIVAVLLLAAVAAYGHHSYAATYDTAKEVKLQGKLIQFVFRNPHSYVTIQAPDARGRCRDGLWSGRGPAQLSNRGITQETSEDQRRHHDCRASLTRARRIPVAYGEPDAACGRIQLGDQIR